MASPICIKRLTKERMTLEKHNPDYFVRFKDDNLQSFDAYIYGPADTLYSHKLLKLHVDIPNDYPFKPPNVKFIQYGRGRYHPNLYAEGKVCLSILGTWPGEKWAQAMTVETVLVTIRSLLDNRPFMHEPGGKDDQGFNSFVEYAGWQLHLLDHVAKESEPVFQAMINHTLRKNGSALLAALDAQAMKNSAVKQVTNRYERTTMTVDYPRLKEQLSILIMKADGELTRLARHPTHGLDVATALARLESPAVSVNVSISSLAVESSSILAAAPKLMPSVPSLYQPSSDIANQRHISPSKRSAVSVASNGPAERPDKKPKQTIKEVIDLT